MEVVLCASATEAAALAADAVERLLDRKPDAVLGLATGSSPLGVYDELARRVRAGTTDPGPGARASSSTSTSDCPASTSRATGR